MTFSHATTNDIFHIFKRMTPLIQSACEGDVEEVRALLEQGCEFDTAALMGAAMGGHEHCLALFLPVEEKHWRLALINATMEGQKTCARLLLDTQPAQWTKGVEIALMDSVRFNHPDCTLLLLEHIERMSQDEPQSVVEVDWNRLAAFAVEYRNTSSFCAVFPFCDHTSLNMAECLETAAVKGLSECVRLLVPLSPQWGEKRVHDILMQSVWKGHEEVVRLLLPWVNARLDNSMALQVAVGLGDEDIAEVLFPHSDLEVVLEHLQPQNLPDEYLHRLRELINVRRQHTLLTTVTDPTSPAPHRHKKL